MPTLHFIHGKPGAGKTRLARELAATLPAALFCEDEWIASLFDPVTTLAQFVEASGRVRRVIAPLATQSLQLGVSVVFDFAGNTPHHRAWVRQIFEAANADHVLHVLDVPDDECKRRVRERNLTRPAGLYFGDVGEAVVDQVVQHITLPADHEGFNLRRW